MVKKKRAKFVQIVSSPSVINALDGDGGVYVYLGNSVGWKLLNMKIVKQNVDDSWYTKNRYENDDIPF